MAIYALGDAFPELPPDGKFWVAPTAAIMGRVRLAQGANVWFGAVLRGDNDWITVGANTNIQDNSVLHTNDGIPTTLGADVTVGHAVVIHGASVGDMSLIGMSATLLNGVKVGRHCVIGAHALLPEGREYPDRSLIVGMPARVVRTLTDDEVKMLALSAKSYVAKAEYFRSALKRLDTD